MSKYEEILKFTKFFAIGEMLRFMNKTAPQLPQIEGRGEFQPIRAMTIFKLLLVP